MDLGAKLPETKVLESKLNKMVKLQPQITNALKKMDKITAMPTTSEVKDKEKVTKDLVKSIEKATDGSIKADAFTKDSKKKDAKVLAKTVKNAIGKIHDKADAKKQNAEAKKEIKEAVKEITKASSLASQDTKKEKPAAKELTTAAVKIMKGEEA